MAAALPTFALVDPPDLASTAGVTAVSLALRLQANAATRNVHGSITHFGARMSQDAPRVNRALADVQRALALSQVSGPERRWLEVLQLKLTRIRGDGLALTESRRATLERLSNHVEEILLRYDRHVN